MSKIKLRPPLYCRLMLRGLKINGQRKLTLVYYRRKQTFAFDSANVRKVIHEEVGLSYSRNNANDLQQNPLIVAGILMHVVASWHR